MKSNRTPGPLLAGISTDAACLGGRLALPRKAGPVLPRGLAVPLLRVCPKLLLTRSKEYIQRYLDQRAL